MKPLAVDLCCGLGGWTSGLLAEGWDVVGFDIERHVYGNHKYPAQLVLQDIMTLDGHQFRGKVSLITASPPCQKYSYMAMPWQRAKALAQWHGDPNHPERIEELNALFNACVRIGKEADCPIIIENVRGAQPWVGRARWNFGSFYLFGDVPALMPTGAKFKGVPHRTAGHWTNPAEHKLTTGPLVEGFKGVGGKSWIRDKAADPRPSHGTSPARKAASAMIAKIPEPLSRHIARVYLP
jgi:hypothetical protein